MAVPKQKTSRARTKLRDATKFIRPKTVDVCTCGSIKIHHRCCEKCLEYNGIKLIGKSRKFLQLMEKE